MLKLYDLVKSFLVSSPALRYDDKALMWEVWRTQHLIKNNSISYEDFVGKAEIPENIRRDRQKVQEKFTELARVGKTKKEETKGTFAYRVKTVIFDNENNTVRYE